MVTSHVFDCETDDRPEFHCHKKLLPYLPAKKPSCKSSKYLPDIALLFFLYYFYKYKSDALIFLK